MLFNILFELQNLKKCENFVSPLSAGLKFLPMFSNFFIPPDLVQFVPEIFLGTHFFSILKEKAKFGSRIDDEDFFLTISGGKHETDIGEGKLHYT
jgi:hypothetical protein